MKRTLLSVDLNDRLGNFEEFWSVKIPKIIVGGIKIDFGTNLRLFKEESLIIEPDNEKQTINISIYRPDEKC